MASFRPPGRNLILNDFDFNDARRVTGGIEAAGQAPLAENLTYIERNKPDYLGIASLGQQRQGGLDRAAIKITGDTRSAGVQAVQVVNQATKDAKAIRRNANSGTGMGALSGVVRAAVPLLGSLFSDESMKDNIEKIDDALSVLRELRPVSYNYKEEYDVNFERKHHGFIAQEYQKVLPDATYHDPTIDKLCIDTGDLIGLLVRAVQQLESKVTRLEAKAVVERV